MDEKGNVRNNGNYTWSELKDPHVYLGSKKPRQKFLSECLDNWKKNLNWTKSK